MSAGMKRKASGIRAASAVLVCAVGVGGEDRSSRDSLQLNVSKRKAESLASTDFTSEPASDLPVPAHLFDNGPEAQGTKAK